MGIKVFNADFYPRSPCGERLIDLKAIDKRYFHFYPRSPCGERQRCFLIMRIRVVFLSTLSLRRATMGGMNNHVKTYHFYPRSPCGERHLKEQEVRCKLLISIHALLAESDFLKPCRFFLCLKFLSTLSLRRATNPRKMIVSQVRISIHALLAESDMNWLRTAGVEDDISIHALLAESDILGNVVAGSRMSFLSTLSLRRATVYPGTWSGSILISIHALLAESDRLYRLPLIALPISIHALLAESDCLFFVV